MTGLFGSELFAASWLRLETVRTPGIEAGELVRTTVVRLGNGLPMDSKVFRPMTITWPVVIFLNQLKSSGKCHGILFPAPITRLRDMAAMALNGFKGCDAGRYRTGRQSAGNGGHECLVGREGGHRC